MIKYKAKKRDDYAKVVKEMHKPVVSEKKKREMKKLRMSLDIRHKPLRRPKSKVNLTEGDSGKGKSLKKSRHTASTGKVDWKKFHNPMVPKEQPKRQGYMVDYLAQKRMRRQEKIQDLRDMGEKYNNPYYDWKALIDKELDDKDYHELLKEKARVIESDAMRKEQHAMVRDDLSEEQEANDMLIDALEAKLSILDRV